MRTVELWNCACNTRYRALCEVESLQCTLKTVFLCITCGEHVALQGKIVLCLEEHPDGNWAPVSSIDK